MHHALRTHLLALPALSPLVGTRIDWGVRSQGSTFPAIVLRQTSGVPMMNLSGPSGWSRDRVAADCWGRTFKSAQEVALALSEAVHGLRATLSDVRMRVFVLGQRSDDDTDDDGPAFRTSLDLMVWHTP